ncbi:hypothetical protein CHUAL_005539 [Chamberlinius hualienensis]
MSASNGFAIPVSESRTFFSDVVCKYPEVTADGKVPTKEFLEACKTIVRLFDLLGPALAPVKYDVSGNIETLEKKYATDEGRFALINDMVQIEIDEKQSKTATQSLLWLKRALEYTRVLLQCIIEDHKSGRKTENLYPFCRQAYETTLKRYHSWVVQKFCSWALHACPWRRDLMKLFSNGREGMDDLVIIDMEEFVGTMSTNLDIIIKMYDEWGLNSDAKV